MSSFVLLAGEVKLSAQCFNLRLDRVHSNTAPRKVRYLLGHAEAGKKHQLLGFLVAHDCRPVLCEYAALYRLLLHLFGVNPGSVVAYLDNYSTAFLIRRNFEDTLFGFAQCLAVFGVLDAVIH